MANYRQPAAPLPVQAKPLASPQVARVGVVVPKGAIAAIMRRFTPQGKSVWFQAGVIPDLPDGHGGRVQWPLYGKVGAYHQAKLLAGMGMFQVTEAAGHKMKELEALIKEARILDREHNGGKLFNRYAADRVVTRILLCTMAEGDGLDLWRDRDRELLNTMRAFVYETKVKYEI